MFFFRYDFLVSNRIWWYICVLKNPESSSFDVMTHFLTSWRTFWNHDTHFNVMTQFLLSWSVWHRFDVRTYFWHHDELFDIMTYVLSHAKLFDVIKYFLTSWRIFDRELGPSWCNPCGSTMLPLGCSCSIMLSNFRVLVRWCRHDIPLNDLFGDIYCCWQ